MQVMQDRLAAVELMLLQKPIVSGHYTGHAYKNFLLPLDKGFRKVCTRHVPPSPLASSLACSNQKTSRRGNLIHSI